MVHQKSQEATARVTFFCTNRTPANTFGQRHIERIRSSARTTRLPCPTSSQRNPIVFIVQSECVISMTTDDQSHHISNLIRLPSKTVFVLKPSQQRLSFSSLRVDRLLWPF